MSSSPASKVVTLIRVSLGAVFLYSGLPKLFDPESFAVVLRNYQLLPGSSIPFISKSLPSLEIVIGASLVLGLFTRVAALLAAFASVGFGIFVTSALARGLNIECGCFSGASKVSWLHAGLDVLLLLSSLVLIRHSNTRASLESILPKKFSSSGAVSHIAAILGMTLVLTFVSGTLTKEAGTPSDLASSSASAENIIVFDPPLINLGTVKQEVETEGVAQYTNAGLTTLKLEKVETSCGCTVPELSEKVLEPGESGTLRVKFHPGSNRGESQQEIRLFFEGKAKPALLQVVAIIDPRIMVSPGGVELKTAGESKSVLLTANRPGLNFRVTGFSSTSTSLQFQASNTTNAGEVELRINLTKPHPTNEQPILTVKVLTDVGDECLVYIKTQ